MNELDELRGWDAGAPPLDDDTRHRARVRLFAAMNGPAAAVRPVRRRPVLRIALAGLVAAAVAATVVVTVDGAKDGQQAGPGSSPSVANVAAAKVLHGAAAWEREHEKQTVVPRDDEFIYSKRIITETERKTGEVKSYTDEMWDSVDGSKRSLSMELGRVMWEEPLGKGGGVWPPRRWDELKKLPTDPEKLVPAIVSMGTSDKPISAFTEDERSEAYFLLGELLKSPTLPEGLRAAAYEGLALVPGVKTVEGVEDSAGRTGVGIAYPDQYKGRYLIFDATSHEFLGFRDERISRDGKKRYVQLSHTVEWGVVDKVRQRP
ncbi:MULTISPECIES: CU044_5270 family protein [Streptomyces]|uniref:CU044_5270 family protein n=1 Tax=Streptomyces TaxID=1883 RepID=UPI0006EBAC23|nr:MULTISPECIES: CU044_5270 family protein [Streptomyces]